MASSPILPIPEAGLDEVLRGWSGRGELLEALASVDGQAEGIERDWTPIAILKRAHRILLQQLAPALTVWPVRERDWLDALPAESYRETRAAVAPSSDTAWATTRRTFGWPPTAFVERSRRRTPDTLLATTTRWTIERLLAVRADAVFVEPTAGSGVDRQLDLAAVVIERPPLSQVATVRPSRLDLGAVSRQGYPWHAVAKVADQLTRSEDSLEELARNLLMPDDEIRWRLFHLGVFGVVVQAAKQVGAHVVSQGPLSSISPGPAYSVELAGVSWDLWFEAGGIWSHYGAKSPYMEITAPLASKPKPLGADILLFSPTGHALVIECKYSANPNYVGGQGVPQALAYATEVKTRLASDVEALVVAPDGTMDGSSSVDTVAGRCGLMTPTALGAHVGRVLAGVRSS